MWRRFSSKITLPKFVQCTKIRNDIMENIVYNELLIRSYNVDDLEKEYQCIATLEIGKKKFLKVHDRLHEKYEFSKAQKI